MRAVLLIFVVVIFSTISQTQIRSSPRFTQQQEDAAIKPNGAIGEVKSVDAAAKQLVIKTDAGSVVTVTVSDKTSYLRLAPGETTLEKATTITLSDLGEGDRVWARGKVTEDRKSVPAVTVVVMNKTDIARKREAERAEWRRRGILGVITGVRPEKNEITVSARTPTGISSLTVPVTDKLEMRRYAPDSIKFSDAKPSGIADLKVGDQVRALGERNADGTVFNAEKLVSGSFQTVAGTVTRVDPATSEIKINDLQSKQPFTIIIKQDAVLRKFPQIGGMMAAGGAARPANGKQTPPSDAPGDQRARVRGGGFNLQDMLDRLPTISISDVKPGDTILVSSTKGADPKRLTAISVVSGADTLLNMIAARQQAQTGPQTGVNPTAALGAGIQFGIGLP